METHRLNVSHRANKASERSRVGHLSILASPSAAVDRSPDKLPVPGARLHDLRLDWVASRLLECEVIKEKDLNTPEAEAVLIERGIAVMDGPVLRPTMAAMLLVGQMPHHFLPGLRIEASLYGHRFSWAADLSELAHLVTDVPLRCADSNLNVIRGLVHNAFLHRRWDGAYANQPVELTITEHRFELVSPGGLHPLMRVGRTIPVNLTLMKLAVLFGKALGIGSGLNELTRLLARTKEQPFQLREEGDSVRLTVDWRKNMYRPVPWPKAAKTGLRWNELDPTLSPHQAIAQLMAVEPDRHPHSKSVGIDPAYQVKPFMSPRSSALLPPAQPGRPAATGPSESDGVRLEPTSLSEAMEQLVAHESETEAALDDGEELIRLSMEERQQLVMKHLVLTGPQSTRSLMDGLGWKRGTTRNVLERLVEGGRVRTLAGSQRSPNQVYEALT